MRVTFRIQQDLAVFHRATDSGEWVAVCCRRGLEELVGHRLHPGQNITGELSFQPTEMRFGGQDVAATHDAEQKE